MPELTRKEKLKLAEKLSKRLQDLLYSEDTGAFLLYLGQKYNLPSEKVSQLSKLVGDVVLRIVPITSLAQEINSKITSDAQAAMNLAQELNTELLAPALTAPSVPLTPRAPAPMPITPAPTTPSRPIPQPITPSAAPAADHYREPISEATTLRPLTTSGGPEIVDLRKTPPPMPAPVAAAPVPPSVKITEPVKPVVPVVPILPVAPKLRPPLTFTRPVEPIKKPESSMPLIEAEPHKTAPSAPPAPELPILPPTPSGQQNRGSSISQPNPKDLGEIGTRPQYIMRPSGLPPTDLPAPENVLDLRKDRGEF